ncbi:glycosyltransferase [Candidatus Saccharibacteria bacterium oral taxon 488]|nr:glycosyltransferase [Candidatus Saccharibacteria bacterium oral taxon 488]
MNTKAATISQPLARSRHFAAQNQPSFRAIARPLIDIVVPVLNEEKILQKSITTLDEYMAKHLPYRYQITIADNGSQDKTLEIANNLAKKHQSVRVVSLVERGRGRALKQVWQNSPADILTYMDVDLSTSLDDFLPMIQPLVAGEAGVAIGSRLMKDSRTSRGVKREFISRCYNNIIKWTSGTKFSDAQCGFKAIRRDVAAKFLPKIKDNEWFFDTELLIKTERAGVPIHEQPVTWIEDTDSRVKIVKTAVDDLKGLYRVNRELDKRSWLEKWTLPVLLALTGALYLFGALHNGMANSYYAAAVQAASRDWTAWLFGGLDAANYVSVDKPPLATMVMGLSARLFGFSSFSMLLPSVLAGVGSVWLVYAAVKRQFGFTSAVIAGATLMLTPVAALMFGFNNPDAILTLMLTASGYAFLRSLEGKRPLLWLGLAGLFTGLAFNTKMLQGLMVLPAMVLVYVVFAKPPIVTRFLHVMFAGVIAMMSTLWWSVLVWLTPAGSRPWVGSTNDNNIWSLIFGYNGFGRLLGGRGGGGGPGGTPPSGGMGGTAMNTAGSGTNVASQTIAAQTATDGIGMGGGPGGPGGGHGPGGTGFGGQTGIFRIFNNDFGPNIAWLLVLALAGGGLLLWILRKTPRTNRGRAAVMFWMLWLLIHVVIFSMTSGVIHPYYVVVMAPAVAALVGISLPFLWGAYVRRKPYAWLLPVLVGMTAIIAVIILGYAGTMTWLMWTVGLLGIVGMIGLLINLYTPRRWLQNLAIITALAACTLAPTVYTLATVNVAHTGSIPTAGPSSTAMQGSNNETSQADSQLVQYLLRHQHGATWLVAVASANESAAIQLTSGQPVMAVGGFNGSDTPLTLEQFKQLVKAGKVNYYAISSHGRGGGPGGGNNEITAWVKQTGTVVNYGGSDVTLYKLSAT